MKPLLVLALILTACTTTPYYTHPDYTPRLWAKDSYECQRGSSQVVGYGNIYQGTGWTSTQTVTDWDMYQRCLEGRGWTRKR